MKKSRIASDQSNIKIEVVVRVRAVDAIAGVQVNQDEAAEEVGAGREEGDIGARGQDPDRDVRGLVHIEEGDIVRLPADRVALHLNIVATSVDTHLEINRARRSLRKTKLGPLREMQMLRLQFE